MPAKHKTHHLNIQPFTDNTVCRTKASLIKGKALGEKTVANHETVQAVQLRRIGRRCGKEQVQRK